MVSVICCPVSPAILSAIGINSTRAASTTTTPKIIDYHDSITLADLGQIQQGVTA